MDEVINVDSSDAEDDSDDVSLFSDEVVASLLREEAEDPIEAKAEADAIIHQSSANFYLDSSRDYHMYVPTYDTWLDESCLNTPIVGHLLFRFVQGLS